MVLKLANGFPLVPYAFRGKSLLSLLFWTLDMWCWTSKLLRCAITRFHRATAFTVVRQAMSPNIVAVAVIAVTLAIRLNRALCTSTVLNSQLALRTFPPAFLLKM